MSEAEIVRRFVRHVKQVDTLHRLLGCLLGIFSRQTLITRTESRVVQQRMAEELVVRILKKQADLQPVPFQMLSCFVIRSYTLRNKRVERK